MSKATPPDPSMSDPSTAHRVFLGGATGATGRAFVEAATTVGFDLVPHVRPQSVHKWDHEVEPAVFDLSDQAALDAALLGCTVVVCAIGTMRKRFKAGDTYETSDIGGTRTLVEAAVRVGVPRFALVSSVGTDRTPGAYAAAKRAAEALVRESGLNWLIVRPSALSGNGRRVPPGSGAIGWLGAIPGLSGWADDVRPIDVNVIGRALCAWILEGQANRLWTGRDLWTQGTP